MSDFDHQRILAHLPPDLSREMLYFGVAATELSVECFVLDPIPAIDFDAEVLAVPLVGYEVTELSVEHILIEAPTYVGEVCHG